MRHFFPYAKTTSGITVRVAPRYLPEQSDPENAPRFVWSYHIRLENHSDRTVQLIARHWIITDGHGYTEEVEGDGVVGEQPVIDPGGSFDYVSGCPLADAVGHHARQLCDGGRGRAVLDRHPGVRARTPDPAAETVN